MSNFWRRLGLGATVVLTLGAVLLGRWQLQRLSERRAINVTRTAALALPPIDLTPAGMVPDPDGRQVVAHGRFVADQVLLRGRVHRSAPGLHVVTAFRTDRGRTVWVLRGFVYTPDGITPPDSLAPPTRGDVTIHGTAYRLPVTENRGQPLDAASHRTYRRLDRDELHTVLPEADDLYVMLSDAGDRPGQLPVAEPPTLDDGPHLSYAIQWFAIALAIASFGVIVIRRDGRGSTRPRAAP